jgi:signal transduction histidine kinase
MDNLSRAPDTDTGGVTEDQVQQKLVSDGWADVQIAQKGHYFVATASKDGQTEDIALIARWPNGSEELNYFHLEGFGGRSVSENSVARPLSMSVTPTATANVRDFAWLIALFLLATLGIEILVIHRGLKKVSGVSKMASAIGPNATSARLSSDGLPSEIASLVVAVNSALDRLEQGFAVQQQFTANAAHELRRPLAIITAVLDTMNFGPELAKLKAEVSQMNRLVEQLM